MTVSYRSMKKDFIYLASKSPRRRVILKQAGIPFRVVRSRYREETLGGSPEKVCLRHAVGKARKAVLSGKARWVLAADTIVVCRGQILGKPGDLREAAQMLGKISGRWHSVFTAVAILDLRSGRMRTAVSKTKVLVKRLSPEAISGYLRKVHALDKAGAYGIQEKPAIVDEIRGSYSNVVGLPVETVRKMLGQAGFVCRPSSPVKVSNEFRRKRVSLPSACNCKSRRAFSR